MPSPFHRAAIVLALAGGLAAADPLPVKDADADRVVVTVSGMPVALPLALIEVPEAQRAAAAERVRALIKGKNAVVRHDPAFGTDASGTGFVRVAIDGKDVALQLVEAGLAQLRAGVKDQPLVAAQTGAQKAKRGAWAAGAPAAAPAASGPVASIARPAGSTPAAPAKTADQPKGAFAAELTARYFYPAGHRAIADLPAQRLIWYKDEAAARKAGKMPPPAEQAAAPSAPTLANADRIFGEGKEIYQQAIAAGNTDRRDQLYEKAFVKLSEAMNIYGALVEKDEENEALAEKLRVCMQLRYGSVKQRRVH